MIFILEDCPKRLDWFKKKFGSNMEHTCDYDEAIQKLSENEYDKIYLDFNISDPKHNGIDVALEMANNGLQKDVPVIIHSDDGYGIRNMLRILEKTHNVEAITFEKLKREE